MTQSDKGHSSNAELADEIETRTIDWPETALQMCAFSVRDWRQIIAALRQSSDKVLVPREPTPEMIEAGKDRLNNLNNSYGVKLERCAVLVWNAMLSAGTS